MAMTKYISTNGGQLLTLSSVYLDSHLNGGASQLPDGARAWVYDRGVLTPSGVCNLQPLYDEANAKAGIASSSLTYVNQYHTAEQVASETFQNTLNAINNSMAWLWGNIENGGLGFIKVDGYMRILQFAGIVSNDNGIRYSMAANGNHNDYDVNRAWLDNCVICITDVQDDRTPNIIIFLTNHNDTSTYYTNMSYNVLDGQHYTPTYSNVASVLTGVCTWGSYLGVPDVKYYPDRGWWIDTAYVRFTNFVEYDEMIGLGLFNGQEVDEDGEPYYNSEVTTPSDGGGSWYGGSESNPASDMDEISSDAINSGFVTLYTPTKANIVAFNDWLWTSITDSLSQQIKRLFTNPMEALLFIAQCHIVPPQSETTSEIKFCGIGSNIYATTITNQFKTYDCGHLICENGDGTSSSRFPSDTKSFMDYQPYSKAEIYLPCIGYKELDINDLVNSDITLKYQIDWVSGSCLAQLEFTRDRRKGGDAGLNNNTLYEFEGNVYTNLPLSASDWKSFYTNLISGVGGLASMLSGSPQGIVSGAANIINAVASQQVSVQKSGSVSSSFGYMGQQDIKVFLTRPVLARPDHFAGFNGYQSNIYRKLSECKGYVELDTSGLWVDKFDGITAAEADMLTNICANGFYIREV